jgi:hypothetical protein
MPRGQERERQIQPSSLRRVLYPMPYLEGVELDHVPTGPSATASYG